MKYVKFHTFEINSKLIEYPSLIVEIGDDDGQPDNMTVITYSDYNKKV